MKSLLKVLLVAGMIAGIARPGHAEDGWKAIGGTLLGGAVGGWAGSQIGKGQGKLAATAGGALLGAVVGNGIGSSLDRIDDTYRLQQMGRSIGYPAPVYAPAYQAPSYAAPAYRAPSYPAYPAQATGGYCREMQTTIVVGGRTQSAYGLACQQPDGTWRMQ